MGQAWEMKMCKCADVEMCKCADVEMACPEPAEG